jgi:hypothetical protein
VRFDELLLEEFKIEVEAFRGLGIVSAPGGEMGLELRNKIFDGKGFERGATDSPGRLRRRRVLLGGCN